MQTTMGKGLGRLLAVQTQVAFNDNAAKLTLIGLAGLVLPASRIEGTVGLLAGLLVLPFVLFAPLCGWLADRFPKTTVLRGALWIQAIVAAGLTAALADHSFPAAAGCFFLLALQAALFSPAKQGILKEWVGSAGLNQAVGAMEALTIVAILAGGFGGGLLLDNLVRATGSPWQGAAEAMALLTLACILAALCFRGVPASSAHSADPFRLSLLWEHFRDLQRMGEQKPLLGAAGGIAWFYGLGGLLYLLLIQVGRETHPGLGAASHAGWLLVLLGGGIIAGALLYGRLSKGKISIGGVPFSALGMTGVLILLGSVPLDGLLFQTGLFALGLIGGTFIIPLNAFLQDRAEDQERGRMIAASNLLTNLMGIGAVGAQVLLTETFHIQPGGQLLGLALSGAAVTGVAFLCQPRGAMKTLAVFLSRLLYRTEVKGAENLPPAGGILLVCNHVSYADALLLGVSSSRPIRFLAFDGLFRVPLLGGILRWTGSIPVSPRRPKEAMLRAAEYLKAGEVVCIFPEGELTRTGEVMGFKRGFELIARKAGVPVVPVHLDSLWGSIFSFSGGRFFWKWPREWPRRVSVSFGTPLPCDVGEEEARQAVLNLGEAAFRARPELRENLGYAALRRLAAKPPAPTPHGLHSIRSSRVCCHLLVDGEKAVLIDTGFIGEVPRIEKCLRDLGLGFRSVEAIVLTHGHLDHTANLARLIELTGAPVYAHPAEQAHIDGVHSYRGWSRGCGWLESIGRFGLRYRPAPITHFLQDGDELPFWGGLRVIHLPGHTAGHCGFYSARHDLLFSGDLFASYWFSVHLPLPILNSCPELLPPTLEKVRRLHPSKIVPNHYDVFDPELHVSRFQRHFPRPTA